MWKFYIPAEASPRRGVGGEDVKVQSVRVGALRAKYWSSVHNETLCINDLYFNNI